jgi:hypothetical protein
MSFAFCHRHRSRCIATGSEAWEANHKAETSICLKIGCVAEAATMGGLRSLATGQGLPHFVSKLSKDCESEWYSF